MTVIESVIAAVKGGFDLSTAIKNEVRTSNSNIEARRLEGLLRLLREIYFAPSGTRVILEMIADGQRPSEELVSATLPSFNDFGYRWDRYAEEFGFDMASGAELGLEARETLHRIKHGKGGVRERIQGILNEKLTFNEEVDTRVACDLLQEIEKLNSAIKAAERAVMDRMKELG